MAELDTNNSNATAREQATAWFARQRMRPLSEDETIQFGTWLRADAAHAQAWSECELLWARVEAVREDPQILAIREQASRRASERLSVTRRWRMAGAIAASVVVGVIGWRSVNVRNEPRSPIPKTAHVPFGDKVSTDLIREASTEVGERSLLVLADGSKVTLNTASAVRADYSGPERRLTLLRGEAFFDVAKDRSRPFVVTAGPRQVIAVGTAFNVRLQDRRIWVTLVEGKVRVVSTRLADQEVGVAATPGAAAVTLTAGSALVTEADGAEHVERLDADRATSWRNGKLVFEGERLADVVAEMNRYSRETLEIADPALRARKVSGVFEPTEGHAFAKALEAYGIARATQETPSRIVLNNP